MKLIDKIKRLNYNPYELISIHFQICEVMLYKGYHIPAEWKYKPGLSSHCKPDKEEDREVYELGILRYGEKKLIEAGNWIAEQTENIEL